MISIKEGTFKMLRPILSERAGGWIVGALVGAEKGMAYTQRIAHTNNPDELRRRLMTETEKIRMQIHKDHPGIREEKFTFGQGQRITGKL